MSMKRTAVALGLGLALLAPGRAAQANDLLDIVGWPFKFVGGKVASGAADKFKPALQEVIVDVDQRLNRHEDKVANIARGLVRQVNVTLEDRILQIKTSANEVTDHALDRVDLTLRNGLAEAEVAGKRLVAQAGREVKEALAETDAILRARTADLDRMATGLVVRTDEALAARIEQIDEAAGRRLGNVDVIASKQRIALERTVVRTAVLIGLVVFAVFAARQLFRRYLALAEKPEVLVTRGAPRTWALLCGLAPALAGHVVVAGLAAGALLLLYQVLPMGAAREAQELLARHEKGLEQAAAHFDYTQARFHASQLEFLAADDAARYRALAGKAELLRDLVARPTLLATSEGLAALSRRVGEVDRLFDGRPDPDVLVLRALVLWETGATRRQEHQAASLAARALRLAPRGFALAPLARAYVDAFLDAPHDDPAAGIGRDAASQAELRDVLAGATRDRPASPLDATIEVARLMRELDRQSSQHYAAMIAAHAQATARGKIDQERLAERNRHARAVVDAWTVFDARLSALGEDPAVLAAFRLNDAVLTRALWFVVRDGATTLAPRLEELNKDDAAAGLKVRMAPARVGWARRYRELLRGPARDIAEFHEAERFRAWEAWTQEFEEASVAHARARTDEPAARWRMVMAAAALGLYVDDGKGRREPLARKLAGPQPAPPPALTARQRAAGLPATLDEALARRGPRLL